MQMVGDIPVFGTQIDEGAVKQIQKCAETASHCALMADHHKGYSVPIGGVVAYEDSISPSGVGYDIGCGNKAVRLDVPAIEVRANIKTIMKDVWSRISFGVGRVNSTPVEHELFDDVAWGLPMIEPLKDLAQRQLGTVGSGNHYVDIFEDERERVWIGVHFGSRGLGHKIAKHFLKHAGATSEDMDAPPVVVKVNSSLGADYLEGMRLAGRYAYAGRDWVCQEVANIMGAEIVERVHNHHNFAWKERHRGRDIWVVRKGATPAFPGQISFIGSTMGEPSVIVEGVENFAGNALTLCSTIHGAGRVMGRMEAAGKTDRKTGEITRAGRVTPDMMQTWVERAGIQLRGAGLDESPDCYKRLPEVLEAQGPTIRVLHTLTPLGVAMASAHEIDPYRD